MNWACLWVATLHSSIGSALHVQGNDTGALKHCRRALAIAEKALGPEHPYVAIMLTNIGMALNSQGDYAGALENYRRALAISEKVLGKDHPTTRTIRSNLAAVPPQ